MFTLLVVTLLFWRALSHSRSQVTSTATLQVHEEAIVPAAAFARRDGLPTLTFGPASNYANSPSSGPTVTSSDLSLVGRSEPTGGLDVFLGSVKQQKIQSIISASCPDNPNSQCIQDVAQAFDTKEVGLQERQIARVVVSVLILAFAYWIQNKVESDPQKASHIFLPETDISQAASVVSSSTLVFVTAPQDPSPVTVMSTDTTDPATSGLVVSTATATGDGYGQGDVVIQVPEDLGHRLHDIIGIGGSCAKPQVNQTSLDCVEQASEFVMLQSQQGAPLRDLVLLTTTLPGLKSDLAIHVTNILQFATKQLTNLALSDAGLSFLAEIAFWVVYAQLVEQLPVVPDQIVIPAASTVSAAPAATTTSKCPPEDRKPNCSNCGGTQINENKTSGLCPGPQWRACPCVDGSSYPNDGLNSTEVDLFQYLLAHLSIVDRDPSDNSITCAGPDKLDISSEKLQPSIQSFCQKYQGQAVGENTNQEWYDNGDGNWINIWVSQDQVTCGNPQQKIDVKYCVKALSSAATKCASGPTSKGGTTGHYTCMNFGFYGADAETAGKPVECPDPNPLLNFAQNPCDTKCLNAGWENCEPDLIGTNIMETPPNSKIKYDAFIKWGCFCKNTLALTSPCAGMKCGDPIKMRDGPLVNGKPRYGDVPYRDSTGRVATNGVVIPPSLLACDVMCVNGNYRCPPNYKRFNHNACLCTDKPSLGQICVDAIRDYGVAGR